MSEDLRVKLGKSKIEKTREPSPTAADKKWAGWGDFVKAYNSGWRKPEPRFPIIISPDSQISSPAKIQELAGLPSEPRISTTTKTILADVPTDDGPNPEKVQICDVNYQELARIKKRTEWDGSTVVWFRDEKRMALIILSLKGDGKTVCERKDD